MHCWLACTRVHGQLRLPHCLPLHRGRAPACGSWSCRCRACRRRCRWSLRAVSGQRRPLAWVQAGRLARVEEPGWLLWLAGVLAARRAATPAALQEPSTPRLTRGLEPLQVAVHVQADVIQLRLLGGAVHKRVAALRGVSRVAGGWVQMSSQRGRASWPVLLHAAQAQQYLPSSPHAPAASTHQAKVLEQVGLAPAARGAAACHRGGGGQLAGERRRRRCCGRATAAAPGGVSP